MAEQKGRLELMMDEFTDVHGTVLLGMHKELQTLKQEVAEQFEKRVAAFSDAVTAADSKLQQYLTQATETCTQLENVRSQASNEIGLKHSSAVGDIDKAAQNGKASITTLITSGTHDLNKLLGEVSAQRKGLTDDINKATDSISRLIQDHQAKLDASLRFADKLNQESQATQAKTQSMLDALAIREAAYQDRLRKTLIVLGVLCTMTIGAWIWLAHRL